MMYCADEPAPTPPVAVGGLRMLVVSVVIRATGPKLNTLLDAMTVSSGANPCPRGRCSIGDCNRLIRRQRNDMGHIGCRCRRDTRGRAANGNGGQDTPDNVHSDIDAGG